jgi:hypothetical protein
MADGRAITAEGLADIVLGHPERDVADIHGNLPHMAGKAPAVAAFQEPVTKQQDKFADHLADDAANGLERDSTRRAGWPGGTERKWRQ